MEKGRRRGEKRILVDDMHYEAEAWMGTPAPLDAGTHVGKMAANAREMCLDRIRRIHEANCTNDRHEDVSGQCVYTMMMEKGFTAKPRIHSS